MKRLFILTILTLIFQLGWSQDKPLPNLQYKTWPDSSHVQLQELIKKGNPGIVLVWNSMMKPAKVELDTLHAYYSLWKEKYQIQIVTIAAEYDFADPTANLKKFLANRNHVYHFDYMLVSTYQKNNVEMGIQTMPYTYVVDKKGNVRKTFAGFTSEIFLDIENTIKAVSSEH